jgi:hypothetical protein
VLNLAVSCRWCEQNTATHRLRQWWSESQEILRGKLLGRLAAAFGTMAVVRSQDARRSGCLDQMEPALRKVDSANASP